MSTRTIPARQRGSFPTGRQPADGGSGSFGSYKDSWPIPATGTGLFQNGIPAGILFIFLRPRPKRL